MFHQFLTQFLNKCIKGEFPTIEVDAIKKIDGKKTQDITLSFNKNLLNLTLQETFSQFMKTTPGEGIDNLFLYLMESNSYLNDLLNMKYYQCFNELFLNSNENAVDQRFRLILQKAPTLQKFVDEDICYRNKVCDVAKNNFLQYFQNSKLRKPKRRLTNSLRS